MKAPPKIWHVYILQCNDNSYYTGTTNNIDKRMKAHITGKGSKYVKMKGFKKLIITKPCKNKSNAYKIEACIKKLPRFQKLDYFQNL